MYQYTTCMCHIFVKFLCETIFDVVKYGIQTFFVQLFDQCEPHLHLKSLIQFQGLGGSTNDSLVV